MIAQNRTLALVAVSMSNFIVLSSQRTGSSLVCQWLENKTGVEYLKELPGHEYKKIEGDKIVNTTMEDVRYFKTLSDEKLGDYKNSMTTGKIKCAESASVYPGFFKVQVQHFNDVERHIVNFIDKIYFCERSNLGGQLLSWYFAMRNGWYSETPEKNKPTQKTLNSTDFDELTEYVDNIIKYHEFKQKMINFGFEYETIIYEDFKKSHVKEIDEIEKTPSLAKGGRYTRWLKKQTLWEWEEFIENWDEFDDWCEVQKERIRCGFG